VDERLLLVEDDPSLREMTQLGLAQAGFVVATASDGGEALERILADPPDLVVLDVMLPTLDGLEVCRRIRARLQTPIVIVTARSDPTDVVLGLELGADDYVTKPFDLPVLVARCRAVLRRRTVPEATGTLRVGAIEVDTGAFVARRDGEALILTTTEFRLLAEFARHPGQVLTREVLLARVWDHDWLGDSRLVDVAVQRLRAKLEADPAHPTLITTVRGVGYRLERPSRR
jgi:two-component system, OmpR family, response regulator MtrA